MTAEADSAQVPYSPALIFAVPLVIGLLLGWVFGFPWPLGVPLLWQGGGAVAVVAGILLMRAGAFALLEAGTNLPPSQPATALVVRGVYRYTRNPIYLAMALIHIGVVLLFLSPIALLIFPLAPILIRTQVIAREERYMTGKFGEAYTSYCAQVRRWV